MKKWKIVLISLFVLIVKIPFIYLEYFVSLFFVVPYINDVNAIKLADEMKELELPHQTEMIEVVWEIGNTTGTGDTTRIVVCMLIKSNLEIEELRDHYYSLNDYVRVYSFDSRDITFKMKILGIEFRSLTNISDYSGYYIIEREHTPSLNEFDLRGA